MNLSYTPRPWLYIAGPYSADTIELIQKNIDAARSAARDAWTLGWYAYCPHLNTAHFDDLDIPYQVWIAAGLEMLKKCDAVLMLDRWDKSLGAKAELEKAQTCGIPIHYLEHGIPLASDHRWENLCKDLGGGPAP